MATMTRNDFSARFENRSINLSQAQLTNAQRTHLRAADLNRDGKIEGTRELDQAFRQIDDYDRNGNRNSINAGTNMRPTVPGAIVNALQQASTPRRGLGGGTTPSGGTDTVNTRPSTSGRQNGVAQIDRTINAGARNQRVDGTITVNGNTYNFRSGGFGRGSLPEGTYNVTRHRDSRSDRSMSVGGVGYSFALNDAYDARVRGTRSLLRIHPDGGSAGTEGCIGIVGDAATQRRFREDMLAEIRRNGGSYSLTVR